MLVCDFIRSGTPVWGVFAVSVIFRLRFKPCTEFFGKICEFCRKLRVMAYKRIYPDLPQIKKPFSISRHGSRTAVGDGERGIKFGIKGGNVWAFILCGKIGDEWRFADRFYSVAGRGSCGCVDGIYRRFVNLMWRAGRAYACNGGE